ncbi:GNAT family N-acetyltransferase [Luteimicrobium sp. NPDC057192]|uniref:GNAT family N-acetyltransferase n=1 Tax=Luteimicrobium sp. NPDC057192 TaxID=3346042 RepID=UPI00362E1E43
MTPASPTVLVRDARLPDDADDVARLLEDYLRRTEREKHEHLGPDGPGPDAPLQPRHLVEVHAPAKAFDDAQVLLAGPVGSAVGVVVVKPRPEGAVELKRFWVDPAHRRAGAGGALLDAAIGLARGPVRLSVWDWRADAIRAYARRGFAPVESWEPDRPRLVCMERRP